MAIWVPPIEPSIPAHPIVNIRPDKAALTSADFFEIIALSPSMKMSELVLRVLLFYENVRGENV